MPDEKDKEQTELFKIDDKNYATDPTMRIRALDFIQKVSHEVRTRRQTLDQRYIQYYNIFRCVFDVRYYEGTSQVYIPQLRKNVESYVARLKDTLFPTDDVLEVQPVDPEMGDQSDVISTYMNWIIDKRVKIKVKVDRFLRQLVMYGWSVVKCVWEEEKKKIYGREKVKIPVMGTEVDPLTGQSFQVDTGEVRYEIREVEKEIIRRKNPTFIPVDNLAFYMYPATANSIFEADGVIELSKQPLWWLKARAKAGDYANTDDLKQEKADKGDLWEWSKEQRLSLDGQTDQEVLNELPRFTVLEYWGKFNWANEDQEPDWKDTIISTTSNNEVLLQLRVNPFYDQEIPYLQGRMTELNNEAYPSGLFEPLAALQYYLNDTYNQTFDSLLYEINPIIKYDPGQVVNINSISFAPGAMWAVSSPDSIEFMRPPDVSQIGFFAASQAKQILGEYPGLQEIPMTGRKAATHITAIQQEYSIPIMALAHNIEEQVLSPWLKMAYCRIQQFVDDTEKFMVTGKKGIKSWNTLTPEMLVADYNFYWRGSNQATNIHVKAEQMMNFLPLAMQAAPYLAMEGKKVDLASIVTRIWRDGMAMDGEVIVDASKDYSIDPDVENVLLSMGKFIPVSVNDDDIAHLQSHEPFGKNVPPEQAKLLNEHIQRHQFQAKQKQMAMVGQGQTSQPQDSRSGVNSNGETQTPEVAGQNTLQSIQPPNPGSP